MEALISSSHHTIQDQQNIISSNQSYIQELNNQVENEMHIKHELQQKNEEVEQFKQECSNKLVEQQNDIVKLREYIKTRSAEEQDQKMSVQERHDKEKKDLENAIMEAEKNLKEQKTLFHSY